MLNADGDALFSVRLGKVMSHVVMRRIVAPEC